ncbi:MULTISPECIES: hypothetical protein [Tenacibaculum]|uniref:hypothetical protein n=1 Tax=Tenacibaculum TaxID=104267 RepID=UPI000896D7F2|nr:MULTISPECIES: hypothetical protein [unclassified Tenacibaculum]RBW54302.1 hypothetical protein DS884_17800 [Tenacibaculum sp. E3R01]SED66196.1 hypothetical protein SAMN04487765_0644 [Tenacibaculum sp. MAR_2010_89]
MNSELISKGEEFETRKFKFVTTSDRILASREAKALILEINEVYKETKDSNLMDLMKRLTVVKQRIDKRLKGKPLTA